MSTPKTLARAASSLLSRLTISGAGAAKSPAPASSGSPPIPREMLRVAARRLTSLSRGPTPAALLTPAADSGSAPSPFFGGIIDPKPRLECQMGELKTSSLTQLHEGERNDEAETIKMIASPGGLSFPCGPPSLRFFINDSTSQLDSHTEKLENPEASLQEGGGRNTETVKMTASPDGFWFPCGLPSLRFFIDGDDALPNEPLILLPKRTYQPSTLKRKRTHGYLARKRTAGGRKVIARRIAKGRWRIAV